MKLFLAFLLVGSFLAANADFKSDESAIDQQSDNEGLPYRITDLMCFISYNLYKYTYTQ